MFNSLDILKKMKLQDMVLYPDFENFILWFGELTRQNELSSDEIAKSNELKSMGSFNGDNGTVNQNIEQIIGSPISDDDHDDKMIGDLENDWNDLKDSEEMLVDMLSKASGTESKIDTQLNRLNSEKHSSALKTESLLESCKEEARMLEELRAKNIENRNSAFTSFSGHHSSPVRWCRIDFDNYCISCDNVALSLKLRFEEKLRLMSFMDVEKNQLRCLYNLKNLETIFMNNASAQFDTECDLKKVDVLIDLLSEPFQPISSYSVMREQIDRLSWQNEDIEENIENLEETINQKFFYMAQQEAKFCELENNKEKFAAAKKRLEILKKVCKPISDNLLLGDLLWVSLDTEMETMKNILENVSVAYYEEENKQCARNLQILTKISANSTEDLVAKEFLAKVSELIEEDVDSKSEWSDDVSNPVAKYNESMIHHDMQLHHAISNSYQIKIVNLIDKFNAMSAQMSVFIGNGPTNKPNIWNLPILADLEVYKRKFDLMFKSSRTMRKDFMEKYHQPFTNDELWKRRQLLWIWFLTDQKRFLEVFENTVGDSNNTITGGMKRQQ